MAVVLNRDLGFFLQKDVLRYCQFFTTCASAEEEHRGWCTNCQLPFLFVINGFLGICHLHSFSVIIFFFNFVSSKLMTKLQSKIVPLRLETTCSAFFFYGHGF